LCERRKMVKKGGSFSVIKEEKRRRKSGRVQEREK
jgi:hypothetical protein